MHRLMAAAGAPPGDVVWLEVLTGDRAEAFDRSDAGEDALPLADTKLLRLCHRLLLSALLELVP